MGMSQSTQRVAGKAYTGLADLGLVTAYMRAAVGAIGAVVCIGVAYFIAQQPAQGPVQPNGKPTSWGNQHPQIFALIIMAFGLLLAAFSFFSLWAARNVKPYAAAIGGGDIINML